MIDIFSLLRSFAKGTILLMVFSGVIFLACSTQTHQKRADAVQNWRSQNGKLKILSTIAMIDDLVIAVGGEYVDSLVLIQGDLDPHSYQLVKGDDEKLAFAHLIFYNGLGLEHGPSLQHFLRDNEKAVGLGDLLLKEQPDQILFVQGQADPHIWMDVALWSRLVPYVVRSLSRLDPSHAQQYEKNGSQLIRGLLQIDEKMKMVLEQIPENKRYLVTSHDAFNYFTRAYLATDLERQRNKWQKRFAAPEGLAPESQLSSADIQAIIEHLSKYQIEVLFSESNLNQDSIKKIIDAGKAKGLRLRIAEPSLYADAMGSPGSEGDTYVKMMLHNARAIAENLESTR